METSIEYNTTEDHAFGKFSDAIKQQFNASKDKPLFTCDAGDLYSIYLDSFSDPVQRQHHTCNCCRQFIERYGNLVVIDLETGRQKSAIWPDFSEGFIPTLFVGAAADLAHAVRNAKVNGVFVSSDKTWGTPVTGPWSHFNVKPSVVHNDRLLTPYQIMAQKRQDFGTLSHGLADFSADTVKTALSLLETDALYRSEKVIGPAKFLHDLHNKIDGIKNRELRNNLVWHAVATAPVGFSTPRSSMVGTLLEDIAAGKSFDSIKRSFAAKMHPLQYQRPQAPASEGNIEQAEKIVAKLGIEKSLQRRFARIDEMQLLWSPQRQEDTPDAGGVFSHLRKGRDKTNPVIGDGGAITWVKFAAKVLPAAERIQVFIDPYRSNFTGVLTAVDPDAPPIFQWDGEENRNPVSWYVYHGGSPAGQWGLRANSWEDVSGVSLLPFMWGGEDRFTHFGKRALFIIPNARDTQNSGLSLFPETLRSELHPIRSTIEAFSRRGRLGGQEEASANGIGTSENMPVMVRVTTNIGVTAYKIDRWD